MTRSLVLWFAASLVALSPCWGLPTRINFAPTPEAIEYAGISEAGQCRLVLTRESADPIYHELLSLKPLELDLEPGMWRLQIAAACRFWSPEKLISVHAKTELNEQASLPIHPASELLVRLTFKPELWEELPEEVHLRFRDHATREGQFDEVTCRVEQQVARCRIPAGELDLRIRATSFLSDYYWSFPARPGNTTSANYALVPGASLVGHVELGEGKAPLTAIVTAQLAKGSPIHADDVRTSDITETVPVNEHGFFHFKGLQPGRYQITAEQNGFGPVSTAVTIVERSETRLGDPIVLWRPSSLAVTIEPKLDAYERPWRLEIKRVDPFSDRVQEELTSEIVTLGYWRREQVPTGKYSIRLADEDGNYWVQEMHELTASSEPVFIHVPLLPVFGTVEIGQDPVQADISFGNKQTPSISFISDEEGEFAGFLTAEGEWDVLVVADEIPRLGFTVDVKKRKGRKEAFVGLELPDTRISGRVVQENGKTPDRPVVSAFLVSGEVPPTWKVIDEDEDGKFVLRGLQEGRLRLSAAGRAESGEILESDEIFIDLEEGLAVEGLRLVVAEQMRLRGKVQSNTGPLPLVLVEIKPLGGLTAGYFRNTGVGGIFEVDLRKETPAVVLNVLPIGFAAQGFRHDLSSEDEVNVLASRDGGTLVLSGLSTDADWVLLNERGGYWAERTLRNWIRVASGEVEDSKMTIPSMEPTGYQLCRLDAADWATVIATGSVSPVDRRCSGGFLAPGGMLDLVLEDD